MCGQAAPGRAARLGPGRAFLFVKEPPEPLRLGAEGHEALGRTEN